MSAPPGLPPAGSSTYTSNTMSVGDGTWDTTRNTFLLPNLVGLNFATMRYNGKLLFIPPHSSLSAIDLARHGKPFPRAKPIPHPHSGSWNHGRTHLSPHRPFGYHVHEVQAAPSKCDSIPYLATYSHLLPGNCHHRIGLHCSRTKAEPHQSTSWCRIGHLRHDRVSVLRWCLDPSQRQEEESVFWMDEEIGILACNVAQGYG